ncbi:8336_t:CDS:2 [Funneliformis caledonium]|uniref:8336_t:CDS:1 n=1 Tax=Funneliformis caledonium TaxID=1117310 RepID=A0A9N9H262_9GLOM|nr:8336_t:CDS:2 [Funneliformis caledonium]
MYEYVNPKLLNLSHKEVDFDSEYWQEISNNDQAETKKQRPMLTLLYGNLIISKGIHNHLPPPPERTPNEIKDDL